jgi:guanylate kinase
MKFKSLTLIFRIKKKIQLIMKRIEKRKRDTERKREERFNSIHSTTAENALLLDI